MSLSPATAAALSQAGKKPHSCTECRKSFSSVHQLAQHARLHTGERPYGCTYCERKFKQLSHLQQHTRLHTGERPFKCDCGRSFIQQSNLTQHMKTHEDSSSASSKDVDKNFFCPHCGKGFKGHNSLLHHQTKKHADLMNPTQIVEKQLGITVGVNQQMIPNQQQPQQQQQHQLLSQPITQSILTYTCQLCNKIYLDESSFKKHFEINHQHRQQQESLSSSSSSSSSTISNITNSSAMALATTPAMTTAITLWPCSICSIVFANEYSLLSHFEQMRFDPKHQKDTQQIVLQTLKQQHQQTNLQHHQQQQGQKVKEENFGEEIALNLNDILVTSLITNGIELETPATTTTTAVIAAPASNQIVSANMIAQNMLDNLSQPTNRQTGNGTTTHHQQQQRFHNGSTLKAVKSSVPKATTVTTVQTSSLSNNSNTNNNSTYWA
ncbi:uncharacterized protein LOC124493931 isoform X1 [Dermatophagoides farinae]|uniref:C2H2-type domain-containing protein n=1 Tax=Dermatophagoides farinae TaxID=6954 RepID=A0A9D4P5B0_DERFA|nr:zinc finger protein 271-like [Dermatophagoides farinae]KAH7643932.1 hypothetical protein HUG17_6294 [Dermatophagoides farinae]